MGIAIVIIALLSLAMFLRLKSVADIYQTSHEVADVENMQPTVDTVIASDQVNGSAISEFTPNEGTTKNLYVHGTASDTNGCSDITGVTVWVFHYPTMPTGPLPLDNNNAYMVTSTVSGCAGANDNDVAYAATIPIASYADPTDAGSPYESENWTALAQVHDPDRDSMSLTTFELNSLAAFDTDSSVNYGIIGLGATSTEQTVIFTNKGNRLVNATVVATSTHNGDMYSDLTGFADIPASAVHYSLLQGFVYGVRDTAVSNTEPASFAIHLPAQTDDQAPAPQVPTYWLLKMPESGVKGNYTNTLNFTAVAN